MIEKNIYLNADGIQVDDTKVSWTEENSYLKEVNYAAKSDKGKSKLSLVPRQIIWDIAAIREYGNNKYPDGGPDNWRSVEPERYRDAAYRHFLRYLDDPNSVDDESGLPHLWHLACNIAFLCEFENNEDSPIDERYKKGHFDGYELGYKDGYEKGTMNALNRVKNVLEKKNEEK